MQAASVNVFVRKCVAFEMSTLFNRLYDEHLIKEHEQILEALRRKIAGLEALVKDVQKRDPNYLGAPTVEALNSIGASVTALDDNWNHLHTRAGKRSEHSDGYCMQTSKKYMDLMESAQNHMNRRGCVIPFPGDQRNLRESGPPSTADNFLIDSPEFMDHVILNLQNHFAPEERFEIPLLVKEQILLWKNQSITQIKSHLRTSKNTKDVIRDKLTELFRAIPECMINFRAAQGLVNYKTKLTSTKHNLAAEREELADKQAREQRNLRRKMEDEKRKLEDLEEDIPVPPEHDFIPPKRSMFKKPKRDAQGDCAMQGQEPPRFNDNDEDDDSPVPPSEDVTPPLHSLMRSMRERAARRSEENKHDAPVAPYSAPVISVAPRAAHVVNHPGRASPYLNFAPMDMTNQFRNALERQEPAPVLNVQPAPIEFPRLSDEDFALQIENQIRKDDAELAALAQKSFGVVNNSRANE